MAEPLVEARVREAYIRPIRSVLVVDDDFNQYDSEQPGRDQARARSLWRACRMSGFLCDIDDGSALIRDEPAEYLAKSDLVILDYHLQGDDPKWALQLLTRLAASDHASIVVVYTKDTQLMDVRRTIAAHLRGGLTPDKLCASPEIQAQWERVETKFKHSPIEQFFDDLLKGDARPCRKDEALLEELTALGVPDPLKAGVAEAYYESHLRNLLKGNPSPRTQGPIQMGGGSVDVPPWVFASNLFVACVQKTADNLSDGTLVFDALQAALCDWKPDFMLSAVAYARAEFARGGFRLERTALGDERLKSGWLYHAWSGSADEQPNRLRALFDRLISNYSARVLDQMIAFGTAHVPKCTTPEDAPEALREAIRHFLGDRKDQENGVLHALNEFLVIEDAPAFVETGTIFSRAADGDHPSEVFVCVTPACDLVPRTPRKDTWEHKLHPARAVIAIRGSMADVSRDHLSKAEESRHVFLNVAGKPKAVTLVGEKPPVPTLEWLFLEDMGRVTDKKLFAMEVGRPAVSAAAPGPVPPASPVTASAPNEAGAAPAPPPNSDDAPAGLAAASHPPLTFLAAEMRVLGQIRALYASRILQYAGQHLARIGVDFVGYPRDPALAKSKKI